MLDTECWVENNQVMHCFYKKECSTDQVIGPKSGFTPQVIRNIILQEYLRRFTNCSRTLPDSDIWKHINRFNLDLMNAGHSQRFRQNMTSWAYKIYCDRVSSGPLYRSREEIRQASLNRPTASDWFKKSGQYSAVLTVQPTLNQELVKSVQSVVNNLTLAEGTKVKVVQGYGRTSISSMMTRNIGVEKLCQKKECLVCTAPDTKGACTDQSVTYQIVCQRTPCITDMNMRKPKVIPDNPQHPPAVYYGETSRSCNLRGSKHLTDYSAKLQKSSLWKHTLSHHDGKLGPDNGAMDYTMTKLRSWPKPLDRQTAEGAHIVDLETHQFNNRAVCLNSKDDFMQSHSVTLNFNMGSNT